jgi:hypothetical protein
VSLFRNYNGRDLLRLTLKDTIDICGRMDGTRLYNEIHEV